MLRCIIFGQQQRSPAKSRVAVHRDYTAEDGSTKYDTVRKHFDSEEDAARAYNRKARRLLGAGAQLNAVPAHKSGVGMPPMNPQSEYLGVHWYSSGRRHWRACVRVPGTGKRVSAGYHLTEEAAAQAYNAKALEVIGPHAPLNNVPPAPPAPPKPARPQSAYRGVMWCSQSSKWLAQVRYKRPEGPWTTAYAGRHESEVAAAQAYNLRAQQVLGDAAQLNDVPEPPPDVDLLARKRKHGYRGVYWYQQRQHWCAAVPYTDDTGRRKDVFVGSFSDVHQAARAYNAKALQLLGPGAELNDVPEGV